MLAYEDRNVDVGIGCGLAGRGQIGKGMWAMPDLMRRMVETKGNAPGGGGDDGVGSLAHRGHAPRSPLPPHRRRGRAGGARRAPAGPALRHPLSAPSGGAGGAHRRPDPAGDRQQRSGDPRLRRSLGGAGDRVLEGPDIHDVGLMEDRATLRISSQHIANWLHHGIVTTERVRGDVPADGRGRRPAERKRSHLRADEPRLRRKASSSRPRSTSSSRGARSPTGTRSASSTRTGARRRRGERTAREAAEVAS